MTDLRRFPRTDIYGITDSALSRGRSNEAVVAQMLAAGIKIIQYREKEFAMRRKYRECLAIRELCTRHRACFIVNDDVDLALAVGADGVHLGQDDLPVAKVRELVGDRMLIGLSVTSAKQADEAVGSGAVDYLGVCPVYSTATKKDAGAAVGLGLLDYVASRYQIPIVAIGGINQGNVAAVFRHGAACAAMISDIVGSEDIGGKIRAIRETIAWAGAKAED